MRVRRLAVSIHRSLGVATALFFLLWFASGLGMLVWTFPEVTVDQRLARLPPLDPPAFRVSLEQAAARIEGLHPTRVHINTFDGRPVYRFATGGAERIVYADTGDVQDSTSDAAARRIAAAWAGQPAPAAVMTVLDEPDQWTVEGRFAALRPFRVFAWPNGDDVYVSRGGEVVQFTTRASRRGAWLGPIPHWLYFAPLRRHARACRQLVLWSSGVGVVAALFGLAVGVSVYFSWGRERRNATARIPYRGAKRWHMALGLTVGVAALTWTFSGLLSMDPLGAVEHDAAREPGATAAGRIANVLEGAVSPDALASADILQVVARAAPLGVTDLEFASFAGDPCYLAHSAGGEMRVLTLDGQTRSGFDVDRIAALVSAAASPTPSTIRVLDRYDAYYRDRRRLRPLPVLLATLDDAEQTRLYVDPRTARIVETYRSRDWTSRWLYHGLHSLDLAWLDEHPRVWSAVVSAFMLCGTALAATSVWLAWRVIGRVLGRV